MGKLTSGGSRRPVTEADLALYEPMRESLAQWRAPRLQQADNPHDYLFFTLFDGTGQDVNNSTQSPTNIGVLAQQLASLRGDPNNRLHSHYETGVGSQKNPVTRLIDGAVPYTWDDKIERMYSKLSEQTWKWKQLDPEAEVRIVGAGYSRGAVLEAGLARLVDQYGIARPQDLKFGRDPQGNITLETEQPLLVQPGQAAQAVVLLDPVATNMPRDFDARLPGSVISGLGVLADYEQRITFPHLTIISNQTSPDSRFLSITAPGGHSNAGGGNREAGLEVLTFNAAVVPYLNTLAGRELFTQRQLPDDPAQYTVHQATGVTAVFGAALDRDGERNLRETLANCKVVDPCRDSEPIDQALGDQFDYVPLGINVTERTQAQAVIETLQAQDRQAAAQAADREGTESMGRSNEGAVTGPASSLPRPFSDSQHPQHALYAELKDTFRSNNIDISEPRLAQFTAALHGDGIKAGDLKAIDINADRAAFTTRWEAGTFVSLGADSPPSVENSLRQVEERSQALQDQAQQQQMQAEQQQAHAPALQH